MKKPCAHCSQPFSVYDRDMAFYRKVSPKIGDRRFAVPPPSFCPDCRKQRRLSYRNDFALYRRTSDMSAKPLLSIYHPDSPFKVYNAEEWWSDRWDPLQFGRDFDFSRPFFEQFAELREEVPRLNVYVDNRCENCDYSNQLTTSKNCYLVFSGSSSEDCYYGNRINNSKNCVDCLYCISSELCYECIDIASSYNCRFSQMISNCSDSAFLFDCQSCHDCLLSIGLRNKSYCIFNKQYSRDEYFRRLGSFAMSSRTGIAHLARQFEEFILGFPRKFAHLKQTENVSGDNVQNAKNCHEVFDSSNIEDVYYSQFVQDSRDCMDLNYGCDNTELHYEVCTSGVEAYNVLFSVDTWPTVSNLLYCDSCSNGTIHCFGSIALRQAKYCILNKQYTKANYEELLTRILTHMQKTGEWGEFFPGRLSPFGYNDSTAQDYFPLDAQQAQAQGFSWQQEDQKQYVEAEYELPDTAAELGDAVTSKHLACTSCSKNYRITAQELAFYRIQELPAPQRCFMCRHGARMSKRNPRRLWSRQCGRCKLDVQTTYPPTATPVIYCESCYLETLT